MPKFYHEPRTQDVTHSDVSFEEGLAIVRRLEEIAAPLGYHTALTGGVLYRNNSKKDVDIIVYPHQVNEGKHDKNQLLEAIRVAGGSNFFQTDSEYLDKDVVLVTFMDKRVDLFFLS